VRPGHCADRVRFDGWVDSAQWRGGIDVLCLPSVWENCSYALLEALGVGEPRTAARVALADPSDPKTFAAAIAAEVAEPRTRPSMPPKVPTVAEMAQQVAEVYRRPLQG